MPWVWRHHHHPRHRIGTGAPVCMGHEQFRHRLVHCQRHGHGWIHAAYRPMWVCPICGMRHYR
jgi:rubrerythrin